MNSRVERRQNIQIKSFRWLNLLVVLLLLFFGINLGIQAQEYFSLRAEINDYQSQLAVVEAEYENQTLLQQTLYDEATIEKMARERLGMVKEGEAVVTVPEVETTE